LPCEKGVSIYSTKVNAKTDIMHVPMNDRGRPRVQITKTSNRALDLYCSLGKEHSFVQCDSYDFDESDRSPQLAQIGVHISITSLLQDYGWDSFAWDLENPNETDNIFVM
jgi:hypothetical protein